MAQRIDVSFEWNARTVHSLRPDEVTSVFVDAVDHEAPSVVLLREEPRLALGTVGHEGSQGYLVGFAANVTGGRWSESLVAVQLRSVLECVPN